MLERRQPELKELERDIAKLENIKPPFPRIDYSDAVKILQAKGSAVKWGEDLGAEDEALLVEGHDRPVFIYNYPKEAKAFYMKENPGRSRARFSATICWRRKDTARSSAGHSARTTTTSCWRESRRRTCRSRRTTGIWT